MSQLAFDGSLAPRTPLAYDPNSKPSSACSSRLIDTPNMLKLLSLATAMAVLPAALFAQSSSTITVNTSAKAQTISGFGAAIGYFDNWVTAHPNKTEVYKLIFSDLNLGILRLRNTFGYPNSSTADPAEIVQQAGISLGHPIDVLLSSWSPPANLKLNNTSTGGTLLSTNGQFVYADFAQWWSDSLQWYAAAGVKPAYISLQNEPDFETTSWDTSILKPTASASFPSYGVALSALFNKLQGMVNRPKILGPEVTGVGFNNFQNYADNLDHSLLDGYAYHLYNGGDGNNPDSFNPNLNPLKVTYTDKPNIMTEFSGGTWFNTAWLIQNCLLNANASGYLYWDLVWGRPFGTGGLVSLENSFDKTTWTTANGYIINPQYYALKHFSKSISKGYVRILSSTLNPNLRPVTFISPDGNKLVAVVINIGNAPQPAAFAFSGFSASSATGWQSVENSYYIPLGSIAPASTLTLPALSVTTLEFSKGVPANIPVAGVTLSPAPKQVVITNKINFVAAVVPSNATNSAVTWTSSNPSIASVSAAGVAVGLSAGTVTITVRTQDGGFTASSTFQVVAGGVSVTGVTVAPTTASIKVGDALPLRADVIPATSTINTVTWMSNKPTVATVSPSGVVTGVAPGSAVITATTDQGALTSTAAITVTTGTVTLPCASPIPTLLPFAKDGPGEFCWVTSGNVSFVNSWNTQLIEINGVAYTNKWSNSLPPRINGNYYIHYVANVSWAHFEVKPTP